MADMCGPSNGLASFQKHTTIDRTLQQDRLITRQSPSQGFRSSGPNARQLDPEFEAFQAGHLPLDPQGFQQPPFFPAPFQNAPGPGPVNWASDFQRMNISSPPPQAQYGLGGQVQQRNMDGGVDWHQEFSRQQNQNSGPSVMQGQQQNGYMGNYASGMGMGMGMGMSQHSGFQAPQESFQAEQPVEQFDDAAFERAFQDAANAEVESHLEIVQEQANIQTQEPSASILEDPLRSISPPLETLENALLNQDLLGADTIHNPYQPEEPQREDPDALARTAQQLLNNLSGDTDRKMQESEFMKLMRGFAQGTQVVKGDDVVFTNAKEEGERRATEALEREERLKVV